MTTAKNGSRATTLGWETGRPSVAIVGAGFGGISAAVLLNRAGYRDLAVFERGDRVGGVWSHNTYPGIACDVPSHLYEFSFAPNPDWSRRYSPGEEIQAYVERVAREEGVLDRVRTNTEVTAARFDEDRERWVVHTSAGEHEADVLITACGQLSVPTIPPIPGKDDFAGPSFHTAEWDHDVDVTDKRVAIIGTGCSTIQVAPAIQPDVAQLDIYQRSPGWTIPKMDHAYPEWAKSLFRRVPAVQWLDRMATFAFMDVGAAAMTSRRWMIAPFAAAGRKQIEKAIDDPVLRAKVTPEDEIGCKRIMLTDAWYPTLTKPNVDLVTDPIERITAEGVQTADGTLRPADVIVFGTGFKTHAFVAPMEITGRGGQTLEQKWAGVPKAYYGLTVSGFPNMFLLYGPNTNGGTGSVIYTVEAGTNHVIAALRELEARRARTIELRQEAADAFDRELRAALATSVWHTGCTSWYVDEDGNDPSQWPHMWSTYRRRTAKLAPGAYELA
jgi:cation diffusion facilitator CzcD-associated flavoprotein CzcO